MLAMQHARRCMLDMKHVGALMTSNKKGGSRLQAALCTDLSPVYIHSIVSCSCWQHIT